MQSSTLKPLVITAGEPAGIGPDICLQLAAENDDIDFVVIADKQLLQQRATKLGIDVVVSDFTAKRSGKSTNRELRVLNQPLARAAVCGQPSPDNARSLLDGLQRAIDGCLQGEFSGLVTGPLQKSVINDAGIAFTGHTEFLAQHTGAATPVMMLVADRLRVALASTHLPLREVPDYLTQARLAAVIEVLHTDLLKKFRIAAPRIIVCGLNPHAGEAGHLGIEEQTVISPVLQQLRQKGWNLVGPLPADTAFTSNAGAADAVLAMYHDQGLPVLKYAGFGNAVNVTLGLPIIRTSVDHGTALDIAGSGKADVGSLRAAVRLAHELASH